MDIAEKIAPVKAGLLRAAFITALVVSYTIAFPMTANTVMADATTAGYVYAAAGVALVYAFAGFTLCLVCMCEDGVVTAKHFTVFAGFSKHTAMTVTALTILAFLPF